jgi:hypothetical protein
VADYRDPWTDLRPQHNYSPRGIELYLVRWLEKRVLASAGAVTSTGTGVADLLCERHAWLRPKIRLIRNGYDVDLAPAQTSTGHVLALLFAGELYAGRNPFPLLEALERLLHKDSVRPESISITLMGKCSHYNGISLAGWLNGRACESIVSVVPRQPMSVVATEMQKATVLLNLAQNQPLAVPAKSFEQLAAGREMLLVAERGSETATLLGTIPGVTLVDGDDPSALDTALEDFYHRHVVEGIASPPPHGAVRQFSRAVINVEIVDLVKTLAAP